MYKPNYLMMTPGPTIVRENVLEARSKFLEILILMKIFLFFMMS